jgi:hypothetical protein
MTRLAGQDSPFRSPSGLDYADDATLAPPTTCGQGFVSDEALPLSQKGSWAARGLRYVDPSLHEVEVRDLKAAEHHEKVTYAERRGDYVIERLERARSPKEVLGVRRARLARRGAAVAQRPAHTRPPRPV